MMKKQRGALRQSLALLLCLMMLFSLLPTSALAEDPEAPAEAFAQADTDEPLASPAGGGVSGEAADGEGDDADEPVEPETPSQSEQQAAQTARPAGPAVPEREPSEGEPSDEPVGREDP